MLVPIISIVNFHKQYSPAMLDHDSFMKSSPFQLALGDHYNLSNTTPELLKFLLQEQSRAPPALAPLLMDAAFNSHLQAVIDNQNVSIDDDTDEIDEYDEFLRNGVSGASTPSSEISEPLKAVTEGSQTNYMNLKVLIENSVFETSKMSLKSVLSLHKAKQLKQLIADKKEHKEYLEQRIAISNQFCSTLLNSPDANTSEMDSNLLLKIFKQNIDLQQQLMNISADLDQLSQKLTNHNLACLVLGYIKDVELSNSSSGLNLASSATKDASVDAATQQSFESLFAHIASLAVQKNVPLPDHSLDLDNTFQGKIAWAQSCINALVNTPSHGLSAPSTANSAQTRAADNSATEIDSVLNDQSILSAPPYDALDKDTLDKMIYEYKIALKDLRFTHQFFMKDYEYLKETSLKTIQEYRRKNAALEKEVSRYRNGSSIFLNDISRDSLDAKDKEIAKLRRDINLLKVELFGSKSPRNSTIISSGSISADAESDGSLTVKPQKLYATSSMSNAILRKEFKKLVSDMQDRYEVELGEERLKRRQLEEKLLKLDINH